MSDKRHKANPKLLSQRLEQGVILTSWDAHCLYCSEPVQRRGLLRRWRHVR